MRPQKLFWLNIVTIGSFVLYVAGIYVQVAFQGITWGNVVVNFALQTLGNEFGVVIVAVAGSCILIVLYLIPKLHVVDVFLCWFWILSLYQCATNSFLQFSGMPDEPINQFFKLLFPTAWYPAKEVAFILAAAGLTALWVAKAWKRKFQRYEMLLVLLLSAVMIVTTVASQVLFLNA